jgi:outer membrane protein assembly factor BamD
MRRIALLLLLVIGCSSSGPRYSQMDADALLQFGLDRKTAHKWTEAQRALETFIFQFPTHARYQEARYKLAEMYFDKKEFITAASEYNRLANDFPQGEFADDSRFAVCLSYYRLSPKPELDQEYTRNALDYCQLVINYYPDTDFATRAQTMLAEMRDKLADKVYMNGEFYFKRKVYDSGIIYFNDVLELYPMTPAAAKSLMKLYETYLAIGYTDEATETKDRLLKDYPESPEAQKFKGGGTAGPA